MHGGRWGSARRPPPHLQTTEATSFSPKSGRLQAVDRIGDQCLGGCPLLVHLVRLIWPARATTSSSIVQHLWVSHRAWIEPGEWLSTTELQSKRSNPNARRQMGVRKEAAPSPPNHGGDEFLT